MTRDQDPRDDGGDEKLDALVADAFTRRGDLPPTTTAEVRAAMDDGAEYQGDLPASLRELAPERRAGRGHVPSERRAGERRSEAPSERPSERGHAGAGAASQRVVSLEELRRQREKQRARPSWVSHAATFALGAAAAAALLLSTRSGPPAPAHDPAAGVPSTSASTPVPAPPAPIAIPAITACASACCAGSSCAAAKGELRKCIGGRTCIGCEETPPRGSAYRVHIGNLVPAKKADPKVLEALDLCARFGSSSWSCEPAVADAATRPEGRTLPTVASAADLSTSIELELRPRGGAKVYGRWRDAIRVGPTVLCHGLGALVATDAKEDVGSVSIALEDAHFVELGRAGDVATLKALRATLTFADVVPALMETTRGGPERFALTAGPFDKATADRLRWALLERGREAQIGLGADHVGAAQALP